MKTMSTTGLGDLLKTFWNLTAGAMFFVVLAFITDVGLAQPICLHPENPRWFQWRGRTVAMITSAEHYGAVLNLDFDFEKYLETLQRDGMNYTRVFTGSYVEPAGAFGIEQNTLAPANGRFLAPWPRSGQSGYAGGGNKFDLGNFSAEYLTRLKDFIRKADECDVVVELTFFCSTYGEPQWKMHPLNPDNNIQGFEVQQWRKINTTLNDPTIRKVQVQLVRKLVQELNEFDNLIYEIQNEPWADNHTMGDVINPYMTDHAKWPNAIEIVLPESVAWQIEMADAIVDEEKALPQEHLIAQNIANFRLPVSKADLVPAASILNFHYAYPEVVDWNRGWDRAIGYDETGFAGRDDQTYRRQAWNFVMSGGALFNNLDYSFTVANEDGNHIKNQAPGGGSPELRKQLRVLSDFLHSFELEKLNPDPRVVHHAPGVVARCLSDPGNQYAIYLQGKTPTHVELNLNPSNYSVSWIDTVTGKSVGQAEMTIDHQPAILPCPVSRNEIALKIHRVQD